MEELFKKHQKIRFSGAGASHQNGSTERATKTVVTMARTMFMHTLIIFTEDKFSTDIWPVAMYYTVWVFNWIPDIQSGLSAIKIWSRSRFEPLSETHCKYHVWGFPIYVLEPKV